MSLLLKKVNIPAVYHQWILFTIVWGAIWCAYVLLEPDQLVWSLLVGNIILIMQVVHNCNRELSNTLIGSMAMFIILSVFVAISLTEANIRLQRDLRMSELVLKAYEAKYQDKTTLPEDEDDLK